MVATHIDQVDNPKPYKVILTESNNDTEDSEHTYIAT